MNYGQPGYGQAAGYGVYQQPQQQAQMAAQMQAQYTEHFLNVVLQMMNESMRRGQVEPQTFNTVVASLNPQMRGDPNVSQNINDLLSYVAAECARMGSNDPVATRQDILFAIVDAWTSNTVGRLRATRVAQQPMMGGGYGQQQGVGYTSAGAGYGGGYGGGGYMSQPAQQQGVPSGMYAKSRDAQQQSMGGYGTPAYAPAPAAGQQPMQVPPTPQYHHQSSAPAAAAAPMTAQAVAMAASASVPIAQGGTMPNIAFNFERTPFPAPIADVLATAGVTTPDAYLKCECAEVDATLLSADFVLGSHLAASSDEKAITLAAEAIPAELLDGEFSHRIAYEAIRTIDIPTSTFTSVRESYKVALDSGETPAKAIIQIIDDLPRRQSVKLDEFLTRIINQWLDSFLRIESDPGEVLSIDKVHDLTELLSGDFTSTIKNHPDWNVIATDIVAIVLNSVLVASTFIEGADDPNLSDLVAADDLAVNISGKTKYSLVSATGAERSILTDAILGEHTVLRLKQSVMVTNTLSPEDLVKPDISASSITSLNEQVFGVTLAEQRKFGRSDEYPIFQTYFYEGDQIEADAFLAARWILRANDTGKMHFV